MTAAATIWGVAEGGAPYAGLRMTAENFFQLPDDGYWYELIDGVVCVSPSPTPVHQRVALEIGHQLLVFLEHHPVGQAYVETDIQLGKAGTLHDVVYRPEIVFYANTKVPDRLTGPPQVVVEVVLPHSRRMDMGTKKDDYERFGVKEYWIVNPDEDKLLFFRLKGEKLAASKSSRGYFLSHAIPGFRLNIGKIRAIWKNR